MKRRFDWNSPKMYPLGMLYDMFEKIQKEYSLPDLQSYYRLIEVFGDVCRIQPMPAETREMCDALGGPEVLSIRRFIISSHDVFRKTGVTWDYLGRLYESLQFIPDAECHGKAHKQQQGISLTPEWLVQFTNDKAMMEQCGLTRDEKAGHSHRKVFAQNFTQEQAVHILRGLTVDENETEGQTVFEPSCGSGRFVLDALCRKKVSLVCGVEKDPWVYRTCLVNCRIYFFLGYWTRWRILNADFILNDCKALLMDPLTTNRWNVPHWEKLPMSPDLRKTEGETFESRHHKQETVN